MFKTNCFNENLKAISYSLETTHHKHDYYQCVLPLKGHLELQIGSKFGVVHSSVGAFIRSQETHAFASKDDNLFLVLDISNEKPWLNMLDIPDFWQLSPSMNKFLSFAEGYLTHQNDSLRQVQVAAFLEHLLLEQFNNRIDNKIAKIIHWLNNNFSQPICLKSLANQVFLSVSQLQRRFKEVTGETIGDYWRRKRINKAKILLGNPRLSIELIAYQVGYENLSAFSRSFTREVGLAPSIWQKMTFPAKSMLLTDKPNR